MIMYHPLDACCFIFSGQRCQPVLQIPRRKITNDDALGGLFFCFVFSGLKVLQG